MTKILSLAVCLTLFAVRAASAQEPVPESPGASPPPALSEQAPPSREAALEARVQQLEEQLSRQSAPSGDAVVSNAPAGGESWRYRQHNGRWWYWLPSNRWVIWDGGQWIDYVPTTVTYVPSRSYAPAYNYGYSRPYYSGYRGYGGVGVGLYLGHGHLGGHHHSGHHHGVHHHGGHHGGHGGHHGGGHGHH
jgi:hypothetical protein